MPETKPLDLPQQSHPEVAAIADVPLKQAASKAAFIGMLARVHWVLVGNAGVYLAALAIIVNHDKGGFNGGHLTIEVSKFMGLSSERIFACHLDSPHGQSVRDWLTRGADRGSIAATPLDAAVEFVKNCGSLAELRKMCAELMSGR
jgi:hypothetical protein